MEITKDHMRLLASLSWEWQDMENGGPAVDCKRPFGNSSFELDIAEILGWKIDENGLTEEQENKARKLYEELLPAIKQILEGFLYNADKSVDI